jgi:hypothetical protein
VPTHAPKLKFAGTRLQYPTEETLREFLLDCAGQFHKTTGMSRSEIGRRALNDAAFLNQVKAGRHLKVRTFETVMRWLDEHWPADV